MSHYIDRFSDENFEESESLEILKKKIKTRSMYNSMLLDETIMRIKKNSAYSSEAELIPLIKLACEFDKAETALSLLHNCHVIRINNGYTSDTKRLASLIGKILGGSKSIKGLEKAVQILSAKERYNITTEEMEEIQKEMKRKEKPATESKKAKKDDETKERELPSTDELKKIEKEYKRLFNNRSKLENEMQEDTDVQDF
ncbi:MAG: hypothetical protein N3G74_00065 [Candidatus Micrarchaeota archaeon]|nr:hypothetical protein [Candidatus Micrarchaeota archaeon]